MPRARSLLIRIARSTIVIVIGALVVLFVQQRSLIYHPQPDPVPRPSAKHYPGLEDVRLTTEDGVELHAWYWPAEGDAPAILFLHGNAGDRGDRLGLLRRLHERGYPVLGLDYRGYGGSAGDPTEAGLYADAVAAQVWLRKRGHEEIVYHAESLGTGVAVELATRHPPRALILEAPYDALAAVGRFHFPWLPVGLLLRDRFASVDKIGRVTAPLLVFHGDADEIVPQRCGRALFEAANAPKTWRSVPEATHNGLRARMGEAYYDEIDALLARD